MSGGSYNYLFMADDLITREGDILRMADRLAELGLHKEADRTAMIVHSAKATQRNMADLWQAVEWRDSCDWGDEELQEAIEKYRELNG